MTYRPKDRRQYWVHLVTLAVILAAVVVLAVLWSREQSGAEPGASGPDATTVMADSASAGATFTLLEVVDGDTIWVRMADGTEEKVRYIGIDCPELPHEDTRGEYLGPEAKARNAELLRSGPLRLQTDVEERDEYGRLLAYVWASGVFVNERLVLEGYAWAHNYPPNLAQARPAVAGPRQGARRRRGSVGGQGVS